MHPNQNTAKQQARESKARETQAAKQEAKDILTQLYERGWTRLALAIHPSIDRSKSTIDYWTKGKYLIPAHHLATLKNLLDSGEEPPNVPRKTWNNRTAERLRNPPRISTYNVRQAISQQKELDREDQEDENTHQPIDEALMVMLKDRAALTVQLHLLELSIKARTEYLALRTKGQKHNAPDPHIAGETIPLDKINNS